MIKRGVTQDYGATPAIKTSSREAIQVRLTQNKQIRKLLQTLNNNIFEALIKINVQSSTTSQYEAHR